MKLRKTNWFDITTEKEKYSFQAWCVKSKKWLHVLDEFGPCIYDTKADRDNEMAEVKQKQKNVIHNGRKHCAS